MWQTGWCLIADLPCFLSLSPRGSWTPRDLEHSVLDSSIHCLSPRIPVHCADSLFWFVEFCPTLITNIAQFLLYPPVARGWLPDGQPLHHL
ncbi:hypothetical protein BJX70DRAFT_238879 [Aspergillus crustosus]